MNELDRMAQADDSLLPANVYVFRVVEVMRRRLSASEMAKLEQLYRRGESVLDAARELQTQQDAPV